MCGLRASYGPIEALHGTDLQVGAGEMVAVLGPNGAGKSTLLACLAGLRRPDTGRVELDGRALIGLPPRERARRIGWLAQTPEVAWAVDVQTLVGLGRLPHLGPLAGAPGASDRAAIARSIEAVGMTAFSTRTVTTLSGGERGRALLARALAGEPEWLLADEPLTGLDPGRQFDACDLFRRIAGEGTGVVLTLHDLGHAARVADRVILLHGGRILVDAPPAHVLTPARIAEVYGVEARLSERAGGLSLELIGRARSL